MRTRATLLAHSVALLSCAPLLLAPPASAQSSPSLADLRWSVSETRSGRFLVAPGQRALVGGYGTPGLEVWTYPLQLLRGYRVTFRLEGETTQTDGQTVVRSIEHTPVAATRVYEGPGFTVRERIFTPVDVPGAAIRYTVESSRSGVLSRPNMHWRPLRP